MQERHSNRNQYFNELANTAREFYIDYLKSYADISMGTRVLEIGCGEGGNLLPFAEIECKVTGIDISETRIEQARSFFEKLGVEAEFFCQNFITAEKPQSETARYDIILIHDVIEHIEPEYKHEFVNNIKPFLRRGGLIFFGFPAWQNPFGGHQQITRGFASKIPFLHLLPNPLYRGLLRMSGVAQNGIDELMSIKRSKMPVEKFERIAGECGLTVIDRTLYFINPHYKQKFGLRPRLQWKWASAIPYLRNYYTTSAFYLLRINKP